MSRRIDSIEALAVLYQELSGLERLVIDRAPRDHVWRAIGDMRHTLRYLQMATDVDGRPAGDVPRQHWELDQ